MGSPRLSSPVLRIIRDGQEELELQTTNADLVRWDKTRAKHRWPKVDEAPFLWLTFIGWAAARRTGAIPADLTYETWENDVLGVAAVDDDNGDDGDGPGFPTRSGAELD